MMRPCVRMKRLLLDSYTLTPKAAPPLMRSGANRSMWRQTVGVLSGLAIASGGLAEET
jgi:hypothetical protein